MNAIYSGAAGSSGGAPDQLQTPEVRRKVAVMQDAAEGLHYALRKRDQLTARQSLAARQLDEQIEFQTKHGVGTELDLLVLDVLRGQRDDLGEQIHNAEKKVGVARTRFHGARLGVMLAVATSKSANAPSEPPPPWWDWKVPDGALTGDFGKYKSEFAPPDTKVFPTSEDEEADQYGDEEAEEAFLAVSDSDDEDHEEGGVSLIGVQHYFMTTFPVPLNRRCDSATSNEGF